MSIQPNRVLARIVEQVDRSDWPELRSVVYGSPAGSELLRLYVVPASSGYATAVHFWVHALREELVAHARRIDLVAAAGQALCRNQSIEDWRDELQAGIGLDPRREGPLQDGFELGARVEPGARAYRMLESDCRRSSVLESRRWLVAHFWGHGPGPSWRREAIR